MRMSDWSSDVCASDLARGLGRFARADGGDARRIAAVHLPCADARGRAALGIDDRVRLHMLGDGPGEERVGEFRVARRARRDDFQFALRDPAVVARSEEHTSELQSLMRISYAVCCLQKKTIVRTQQTDETLTN